MATETDPGDEWVERRKAVLKYRRSTTFDGKDRAEVDTRTRTHGKASTYRAGCRCEECREAKREQAVRRRRRQREERAA